MHHFIHRAFPSLVLAILFAPRLLSASELVFGDVRVQLLADRTVRIEQRGPRGFEDRPTFHVSHRPSSEYECAIASKNSLTFGNWEVIVPGKGETIVGVTVQKSGKVVYRVSGSESPNRWLPGPGNTPEAWAFGDTPRVAVPEWGAVPAPRNVEPAYESTSGWDVENMASDVYVVLAECDHAALRRELISVVGRTVLPPLYAFGVWDSRWHPYTETTALGQIEAYRARQVPLDVLVVDTDWRIGASHGYDPNPEYFPDLPRFFRRAHSRGVRVMFNDHPEPVSGGALSPEELSYRFNGLTSRIRDGLDIWWFDRNWHVGLNEPAPGIHKEVWGMRVYHDMTAASRPGERPMIMANVDGIDNGARNRPPNVAARRFPIQWTGDTGPSGEYLRRGIENAVHAGVCAMNAYLSEDLGGFSGDVTPKQYVRWIQYGALSPIFRLHCGLGAARMPWAFDEATESTASEYIRMRYRLLPVLYDAARRNHDEGTPMLRRLDLYWPAYQEAQRDDQYLLGDNILVAPIPGPGGRPVPTEWLSTQEGQPGVEGVFFRGRKLEGEPTWKATFPQIEFAWVDEPPKEGMSADEYSARFEGFFTNRQDHPIRLGVVADDGVRLWLDGEMVIDAWGLQPSTLNESTELIQPGETREITLEYMEAGLDALCLLRWLPEGDDLMYERDLWVPPGAWVDAWTGERIEGPREIRVSKPIHQIPLYLREGSILPLAPVYRRATEHAWDSITLDTYPSPEEASCRLYEDDGVSNGYLSGQHRFTSIRASCDESNRTISVQIDAAVGHYDGCPSTRSWLIRVRRPHGWKDGWSPDHATLSTGEKLPVIERRRSEFAMPFGDRRGAPDAVCFEVMVPYRSIEEGFTLTVLFNKVVTQK